MFDLKKIKKLGPINGAPLGAPHRFFLFLAVAFAMTLTFQTPVASARETPSHACAQAQRLAPVIDTIEEEIPAIIASLESPPFNECKIQGKINAAQPGCPLKIYREFLDLAEALPQLEQAIATLRKTHLSYTNKCNNSTEDADLQLVSELIAR